MNRWRLTRDLLQDIGTWATGIGLIIWQASRPQPSELIVGAALVLIAPGAYPHIKAILPGGSDSRSSERAPPAPPAEPPSSSPDGTDEG